MAEKTPAERIKARKTVTADIQISGGTPEWQAAVKAEMEKIGVKVIEPPAVEKKP
jgi:activator of 2-hydroxyglutaryl-CoA dehydratase